MIDLAINGLAILGALSLIYMILVIAVHVIEAFQRINNKPPKSALWEDEQWWDRR